MNSSIKKIFEAEQTPPLSGAEQGLESNAMKKKKRLALVNPEVPPYFVSQFEKNPKGWIWDLVLGVYVLAIIALVIYIEFKS